MHLTSALCTVRPWHPDDLDALVRHADDSAVAAQLRDAFPQPYTRDDGLAWLKVATTPPFSNFAIEYGGEAVGGIGLKLGTDVERVSAEVGYWLGRAVWGRGIATSALRILCDEAFDAFDLTRIFALPFARNTASRRVLEKAGFALEAILRHSAIKHGEILDQALYARLRD